MINKNRLEKILILILLFCTFIFLAYSSNIQIPDYQNHFVNDFANILTTEDNAYLTNLYTSIENKTTAEVVFVSVLTCMPYDPSSYAQEISNQWKVGKADKNNGLIILYCSEEKKIWVATGYGLEGILPDSKIGRLLDENYVPYRDQNQTSVGIVKTSIELEKIIINNKNEILSNSNQKYHSIIYILTPIFFTFMIMGSLIMITLTPKEKAKKINIPDIIYFLLSAIFYYYTNAPLIVIFFAIFLYFIFKSISYFRTKNNGKGGFSGGGRSSRSGGGGSRGGSFGGGGFGGGGAGR